MMKCAGNVEIGSEFRDVCMDMIIVFAKFQQYLKWVIVLEKYNIEFLTTVAACMCSQAVSKSFAKAICSSNIFKYAGKMYRILKLDMVAMPVKVKLIAKMLLVSSIFIAKKAAENVYSTQRWFV